MHSSSSSAPSSIEKNGSPEALVSWRYSEWKGHPNVRRKELTTLQTPEMLVRAFQYEKYSQVRPAHSFLSLHLFEEGSALMTDAGDGLHDVPGPAGLQPSARPDGH